MTHDNPGLLKSMERGSHGSTVTYNIHGLTRTINGPGLYQRLNYAETPGVKRYNGSVSSMMWTFGGMSGVTSFGYKYSYNKYGWLTSAVYGEGAMISANPNRYTEKVTSFNRNGGITALQRHGRLASSAYGKVDDLTITYGGNRIYAVSDAAPAVTSNGSMDYPGAQTGLVLSYSDWGALTADPGRGITSVAYDNLGNPRSMTFSGARGIGWVYSATREKLRTVAVTGLGAQDYLGNNRAVVNGSKQKISSLQRYAIRFHKRRSLNLHIYV